MCALMLGNWVPNPKNSSKKAAILPGFPTCCIVKKGLCTYSMPRKDAIAMQDNFPSNWCPMPSLPLWDRRQFDSSCGCSSPTAGTEEVAAVSVNSDGALVVDLDVSATVRTLGVTFSWEDFHRAATFTTWVLGDSGTNRISLGALSYSMKRLSKKNSKDLSATKLPEFGQRIRLETPQSEPGCTGQPPTTQDSEKFRGRGPMQQTEQSRVAPQTEKTTHSHIDCPKRTSWRAWGVLAVPRHLKPARQKELWQTHLILIYVLEGTWKQT